MTFGHPYRHWVRLGLLTGLTSLIGMAGLPIGPAWCQAAAVDAPSSPEMAPAVPIAPAAPTAPIEPAPATAPAAAPAASPPAVESAEVFIDRTDYSLGATQPAAPVSEPIATRAAAPEVSGGRELPVAGGPVAVGSFSLSSAGVSWNDPAPEPASITIPTVQSYFNQRLIRTRLGNENTRLIFPLAIPAAITSLFGWRIHPITGSQRLHTGTDLAAPMGTPVLAALAGRVLMADVFGGYGNAIALEHTQGSQQTLYAHLSQIFVKPGELIQQGTVIGAVGSTGNSTGPHLHFEYRQLTDQGWVAVDAGEQLTTGLAALVQSLQVAQTPRPALSQAPVQKPLAKMSAAAPQPSGGFGPPLPAQ
jgi:murein DD-endopeptidase MepM/ murein hydrolase activator NlpD